MIRVAHWMIGRRTRRPGRIFGVLALIGPAGCIQPARQNLSPVESRQFRFLALQTMKQAAASNDPFLRMQALEAFQEVAPEEGIVYITDNIDNGHPGVCFAALMAIGTLRDARCVERVRAMAEESDPNVRIGALYALHRFGDKSRTGELAEFLLSDRDARVRANAAVAIGRLEEPSAAKVLERGLRREKKDAVKLQILEGLALLGHKHATERLIFNAYSANPEQSGMALMFLTNARCAAAEDVFRLRLRQADHPEIKLQAARGLGRLGSDLGEDIAIYYLSFNSPERGLRDDPPEQQITRVRALAALALGAIGDSGALGPLRQGFSEPQQSEYARLAIARAAVAILDRDRSPWLPPRTGSMVEQAQPERAGTGTMTSPVRSPDAAKPPG